MHKGLLAVVALSGLVPALAFAQALPLPSRGALLYDNHCIACHNTQMHWRDRKLVTDWPSLRAEVRRWQSAAQLNWSAEDVDDVARHLNEVFYRFPPGGQVVGALRLTPEPR